VESGHIAPLADNLLSTLADISLSPLAGISLPTEKPQRQQKKLAPHCQRVAL
jgi:hypothetical protein